MIKLASLLLAAVPAFALNPAYLSEMPSVERVLREITAGDAQEAAARQMGAFIQLGSMIVDMSGGRRSLTPDEDTIRRGYQAARAAIQNRLPEKNLSVALRGYDRNRAFQEELFNRFFSPAFRAQYNSITAATNARVQVPLNDPAVASAQPPALAAPSTRPAPLNSPAGPAAPPKPAVARAPDPSIVKARAANVDTKVFGIPLGEPLALPVCAYSGIFDSGRNPTNCIQKGGIHDPGLQGAAAGIISTIVGADPAQTTAEMANIVTIQVAQSNCPAWLSGCEATAELDNGVLAAVTTDTKGREVESAAGKELRGKYGERASMQQRFITPNNGGREFEVWDLDWELPGLHVEYHVIARDIYTGQLRIELERLWQIRQAKIKDDTKPKL